MAAATYTSAATSATTAVVWQFQRDDGGFSPYHPQASADIEAAFNRGNSSLTVGRYTIDLTTMQQQGGLGEWSWRPGHHSLYSAPSLYLSFPFIPPFLPPSPSLSLPLPLPLQATQEPFVVFLVHLPPLQSWRIGSGIKAEVDTFPMISQLQQTLSRPS